MSVSEVLPELHGRSARSAAPVSVIRRSEGPGDQTDPVEIDVFGDLFPAVDLGLLEDEISAVPDEERVERDQVVNFLFRLSF